LPEINGNCSKHLAYQQPIKEEEFVAEHFWHIYLLVSLASVTDSS